MQLQGELFALSPSAGAIDAGTMQTRFRRRYTRMVFTLVFLGCLKTALLQRAEAEQRSLRHDHRVTG